MDNHTNVTTIRLQKAEEKISRLEKEAIHKDIALDLAQKRIDIILSHLNYAFGPDERRKLHLLFQKEVSP